MLKLLKNNKTNLLTNDYQKEIEALLDVGKYFFHNLIIPKITNPILKDVGNPEKTEDVLIEQINKLILLENCQTQLEQARDDNSLERLSILHLAAKIGKNKLFIYLVNKFNFGN